MDASIVLEEVPRARNKHTNAREEATPITRGLDEDASGQVAKGITRTKIMMTVRKNDADEDDADE